MFHALFVDVRVVGVGAVIYEKGRYLSEVALDGGSEGRLVLLILGEDVGAGIDEQLAHADVTGSSGYHEAVDTVDVGLGLISRLDGLGELVQVLGLSLDEHVKVGTRSEKGLDALVLQKRSEERSDELELSGRGSEFAHLTFPAPLANINAVPPEVAARST